MSASAAFIRYYKQRQQAVERALKVCVPALKPKRLRDAMRYSLLAGGKRLRPILVMAAAEACGGKPTDVLATACAFEVLHTYSLVHDDLPAMDDDDLRRGRPTLHKAYDEATAILAGDALLTLAFELTARNAQVAKVGPAAAVEATRILAGASGAQGMVGGQQADLMGEGRKVSLAGLKAIHAGKTGALITAACEAGAVLAHAPVSKRRALRDYGRHIGLAFQVADDILNVVGEKAKMGKAVGSDKALGKATYPALVGLVRARQIAQNEWDQAEKALRPLGASGEPLRQLARFVIERDR